MTVAYTHTEWRHTSTYPPTRPPLSPIGIAHIHKHTNLFTVHICADNNVCRWKECCGYGTCCWAGRACHYHQPRQQNPVFRQERKTVRDLHFFSFYFVYFKNPRVHPELGENLHMQLFPCTAVATCGVQCPLDTSSTSPSAA